VVHAEFRSFAIERIGQVAWAELVAAAGIADDVYLAASIYPDEELLALVLNYSRRAGDDVAHTLEEFGQAMVPGLLATYGALLDGRWRALDVIANTETVVHRAVRLQDPLASPPRLRVRRSADDEVRVEYRSPRHLCALARGIVRGVAEHFGEPVTIDEPACMLRGDDRCELVVRAPPSAVAPASA
jgi:predicted hydrocarbon binding protein